MVESLLKLNSCLPDEEKEECLCTVHKMTELARHGGLLSLEPLKAEEEKCFSSGGDAVYSRRGVYF